MMPRFLPLLLMIIALSAHAEWARLFYTPQQRANLDQGLGPKSNTEQASTPAAEHEWHYFNGEARRDNGQPLRWVNGRQTPQTPRAVKPGESWDADSGHIYPSGRKP